MKITSPVIANKGKKDCTRMSRWKKEMDVMLKWRKIAVFCILGLAICTGSAWSEGKVAIIAGLPEATMKSTPTFDPLFQEMEEVLKANNVSWEYFYVDLDKAPDDAARMTLGKETINKVKAINPKVIIVVFDNVITYVAKQVEDIPVVAGYFFGSPESLGLPTKNITGVARRSFAADIWSIANQITGAKTVSMIGRNNFSMVQVKAGLMAKADALEKISGVRLKDMYLVETVDDWKKHIENCSEDLIYIVGTTMIMDGDKEVPSPELIRWTVDHAKVPVVGATEDAARDGALFSVVTSEGIWGKQMADMVIKIINGTPVSEIPMETVSKGKLLINAKTATEKKIEIPYEILSSADQVFE
ncbi:MAG: hypothetical protein FP814_04480 [Desulfobacterium sp.]|nr:hypothetical protein [Desulfobacteraceae bacterium]MBA3035732.1 hypothetical protein [Desulfobacterium sp.]